MARLEIRRIQVADVPNFLALWRRVYSEGAFLAKGPPSADRVRGVVEKVVKEEIPNFIAVEKDKVVGAVEVFPGTMCGRIETGADRTGHLGIQVDSHYRRRGIGRNLMMAAISDSRRYGFDEIELSVFDSNFVAIRLYEKLGFIVTGHGDSVTLPSGMTATGQYMVLNFLHNKRNQADA